MFICTGVSEHEWPVKIEQLSPIVSKMSTFLKENRDTLGKIKLSATQLAGSALGGSAVSALYFRGTSVLLTGLDSDAFERQQTALLAHWLHDTPLEHGLQSRAVTYSHVLFVCSHINVDKRCGYCGPSKTHVSSSVLRD